MISKYSIRLAAKGVIDEIIKTIKEQGLVDWDAIPYQTRITLIEEWRSATTRILLAEILGEKLDRN